MCGIAGYFSPNGEPVSREPIKNMLTKLLHRGPDGFGAFYGSSCVLGHARLSIIDLEGGWQPISNERRTMAVVFNGEIYNYLELREELKSQGHVFNTKSDTEVIIHAFEEWGKECPRKFNGQFAFAIYDATNRSLFLCRDRVGVRPLYYAWNGGKIIFGSEIKALLASGYVSSEISAEGLDQIYSIWTNVVPNTPFKNVFELPPAHMMFVSGRNTELKRYWSVPIDEDKPLKCGIEDEILNALSMSIKLRLRADVPVGAYVSGGLDSSLITTLIRKYSDAPIKTFSLEFEDPRFDETEYQKEIVVALQTEHSSIRCGPDDIVNNIEKVVLAVEKPILRTAPIPMYLLAKLVRSEGFKVVVTGEGADEFFLGYDIYKEAKVREFCSRYPGSKYRNLLIRKLYPYLFSDPRTAKFQEAFFLQKYNDTTDPFYAHRLRWVQAGRIKDFYSSDVSVNLKTQPENKLLEMLPSGFMDLSVIERAKLVEIATLLSGYLLSSQGDRVMMAHSVEGRFPFLDHKVIELACQVPSIKLMPGLQEKNVLKKIGKDLLPQNILKRKKFPYRAPDVESFLKTNLGRDIIGDEMSIERIKKFGFFDGIKVQQLLQKVIKNPESRVSTTDNLVLMAVLTGQMFFKTFLDMPGSDEAEHEFVFNKTVFLEEPECRC